MRPGRVVTPAESPETARKRDGEMEVTKEGEDKEGRRGGGKGGERKMD